MKGKKKQKQNASRESRKENKCTLSYLFKIPNKRIKDMIGSYSTYSRITKDSPASKGSQLAKNEKSRFLTCPHRKIYMQGRGSWSKKFNLYFLFCEYVEFGAIS